MHALAEARLFDFKSMLDDTREQQDRWRPLRNGWRHSRSRISATNPRQGSDRLKDLKAAGYKIVVKPDATLRRCASACSKGRQTQEAAGLLGLHIQRREFITLLGTAVAWLPMVHAQQPTSA
jgi:hypothetical protein